MSERILTLLRDEIRATNAAARRLEAFIRRLERHKARQEAR